MLCRKWLNSQGHITTINLSYKEKCINGKNGQVIIPFCMSRKFSANFSPVLNKEDKKKITNFEKNSNNALLLEKNN